MDTITRNQCPDDERLEFLPQKAGRKFLHYENLVYNFMSRACDDYNGGFWSYYSLSNNGFYMSFDTDKKLHLQWPDNYFDGEMSADAASIGVNLMAQNAFAWEVDAERFSPAFHALKDYAYQHPEAELICRFID